MDTLFGEDFSFQGYVTGKLAPYLPARWTSFQEPWEDMQRRRLDDPHFAQLTQEENAWWIHSRALKVATRIFSAHHPEVRIQDKAYGTARMFSLIVGEEICIHLKKFRGKLLRSNYSTKHNRAYWWQCVGLFPGLKEYHVIFGYKLFRAETLMRMFLTYPVGQEQNGWAMRIEDQTEAARQMGLAAPPSQGREDERKVQVVPKPKRKQGRKDRRKEA